MKFDDNGDFNNWRNMKQRNIKRQANPNLTDDQKQRKKNIGIPLSVTIIVIRQSMLLIYIFRADFIMSSDPQRTHRAVSDTVSQMRILCEPH